MASPRIAALAREHGPGASGATDADLVARVLDGDRESYSLLVRRHQDALFRYARGMGLDADTASDMVQDTLVKAYLRLADCRNRDRFRSWLVRILRNRCLDYLKNIRRSDVRLEGLRGEDATATRHESPTELRLALAKSFAELPVPLRDAFLLKHQAGYSYDEMAEITGDSVSAMKMRVHRAREALRARLVDQGVERT